GGAGRRGEAGGAGGGLGGGGGSRAGRLAGARRQAGFVDGGVAAAGDRDRDGRRGVADRDGQRGVRQVAVAVLDGVGEDVVVAALRAGVAYIGVGTVGGERQRAVGALDDAADRRGVV